MDTEESHSVLRYPQPAIPAMAPGIQRPLLRKQGVSLDYPPAWARGSAFAQPPQFRFGRLRPGFGLQAGGALVVGAGALVVVGQDVAARGRVVPAQLAPLPAQVQVQYGAVALQAPSANSSMAMGS